jgi:hypothetical protein
VLLLLWLHASHAWRRGPRVTRHGTRGSWQEAPLTPKLRLLLLLLLLHVPPLTTAASLVRRRRILGQQRKQP